jgi:hypothetical protein
MPQLQSAWCPPPHPRHQRGHPGLKEEHVPSWASHQGSMDTRQGQPWTCDRTSVSVSCPISLLITPSCPPKPASGPSLLLSKPQRTLFFAWVATCLSTDAPWLLIVSPHHKTEWRSGRRELLQCHQAVLPIQKSLGSLWGMATWVPAGTVLTSHPLLPSMSAQPKEVLCCISFHLGCSPASCCLYNLLQSTPVCHDECR